MIRTEPNRRAYGGRYFASISPMCIAIIDLLVSPNFDRLLPAVGAAGAANCSVLAELRRLTFGEAKYPVAPPPVIYRDSRVIACIFRVRGHGSGARPTKRTPGLPRTRTVMRRMRYDGFGRPGRLLISKRPVRSVCSLKTLGAPPSRRC